jgi:curved DNA-binding protein CbpA
MADEKPSAYALLSVHRWAPGELITASYWWHAGELQRLRSAGYPTDAALHGLTRAYELISEPKARAAYNEAIGYEGEPLTTRRLKYKRLPFTRRFILRQKQVLDVDYYEALGLAPSAPEAIIAEAARVMRDHYLRLPPASMQRRELLRLLDEAISVLLNEERRTKYDATLAHRFPELYADLAVAEAVMAGEEVEGTVNEGISPAGETDAMRPYPTRVVITLSGASSPQPEVVQTEAVADGLTAKALAAQEERRKEEPDEQPATSAPRVRGKRRQRKAAVSDEAAKETPIPPIMLPAEPPVPVASSGPQRGRPVAKRPLREKASAIAASLRRLAAGAGKGAVRILASLLSAVTRRMARRQPAAAGLSGQEPVRLLDSQAVMFQRPLRRGDIQVEEIFLRRLASSVRAFQPSPRAAEAGDDVSQPES